MSWFTMTWIAAFVIGCASAAIPDQIVPKTIRVLCFFTLFPLMIIAWTADVVRVGSFNAIDKNENPMVFWTFIGLSWCVALGIAGIVVNGFLRLL